MDGYSVAALLALVCGSADPTSALPTTATQITLGGIINQDADDTLAFTPDGRTVFFDRSEGTRKTIMVSRRVDGRWSIPVAAPFSGRWFDQNPVVSPDGKYLLFNSDRPVRRGGKPLVQSYFSPAGSPGSNIWRAERRGSGWAEPVHLDSAVNGDAFVDFPSVAADGTIYYMRFEALSRTMQLWRAGLHRGHYGMPERVILGDGAAPIHDPAVAPDQSFIVFNYGKVSGGLGRLSIAFASRSGWTQPLDLGEVENADLPWGAHILPGNREVSVTGRKGIRKIGLDPWLRD